MSAALEFSFDVESAPPAEDQDYEALSSALNEITNKLAAHVGEVGRLAARREEIVTSRATARRRRARTTLDLHYPPITFFGIDDAV